MARFRPAGDGTELVVGMLMGLLFVTGLSFYGVGSLRMGTPGAGAGISRLHFRDGPFRQRGGRFDGRVARLPGARLQFINYSDLINMQIETRHRKTRSGGGSLWTLETLEVPPMSSLMTEVQLVENRWHEKLNSQTVFIQSHPAASARSGLMVPNSLVRVDNGKAEVLLTNCTAETLLVPKGACVAHFEHMEENEILLLEPNENRGSGEAEMTAEGAILHAEVPLSTNESIEGLDLSHTCLNGTELKRLKVLLAKNREAFSIGDTPGLVRGVEHIIDTGDARPISVPRYHASKRD